MIVAKVLGGETNAIVLQLSNRKNPSICIQSDTLVTLASSVHDASLELIRLSAREEIVEWLVYANNIMVRLIRAYNEVSQRNLDIRPIDLSNISELDVSGHPQGPEIPSSTATDDK